MIHFVLGRYWNICLLKESPENTPYSIIRVFLSGIVLAIIMVIEWNYSYYDSSGDLGWLLTIATCLLFSYVIYTYAVLFLKGFTPRLVQTVTALFYTSIIIHILVAPLVFFGPYLAHIHIKNPVLLFLGVIYLFMSIGLSVWQFVITAHIYKYALSITAVQSVIAAFGLIAVNILTVSSLQ
ncbi:hypothetical protein J2N86_07430 [Legionella lytica]|uniref:Yip1 domain-containing protein n=1 Tax=Legionella lytica TaxID=96232 RepID=A0ABY4Y4M5_9GAMM|nr:hypothetical protein [Legionella lytica]USQ12558.1 hypothetical protein J2N86_07430 [Legionella lytica]